MIELIFTSNNAHIWQAWVTRRRNVFLRRIWMDVTGVQKLRKAVQFIVHNSHAFSLTTCKKLKWHTHTLCKHKVDHYCSLWAIEMNKNPQGNCSKDMELLKDCSHIFCPDSRLRISCELKNSYIHICKDNVNPVILWLGTMGRTQFYDSLHRPPQA